MIKPIKSGKRKYMPDTLRTQIESATDFESLRISGIRLLEMLTSTHWSDFNKHDPGITILEHGLFALTELNYKANLPVNKLMQNKGVESPVIPAPISYYSAPVTQKDLQKILIDIYGISNAWFLENESPSPTLYVNPVGGVVNMSVGNLLPVKGLLDVYVELSSSELKALDNTMDFSDTELNGNILRSVTPASFILGPNVENYFVEFALPYWESFPTDWQSNINIVAITVTGGIPGILYNSVDDVFTAGLTVQYNVTKTISFGVVIRMTPFFTKNVPVLALQMHINSLLIDTGIGGLIQRLNKKIVVATGFIREAQSRVENNRILGTMKSSIDAARIQEIVIEAAIKINEVIDPVQLVTDIFVNIDRYLSPLPEVFSEAELKAAGVSTDQVYNGPLLENGFLPDSSLPPQLGPTSVLFASDLINAMGGKSGKIVPDDYKVLSFSFSSYLNNYKMAGPSDNCLNLTNSDKYRPRLSIIKSKITLFKEGSIEEIVYDKAKVIADFLLLNVRSIKRVKLDHAKSISFPLDDEPKTEDGYYSIQNEFPATYGIGISTLPSTSTAARVAKSRQLKAYLLFYEQLLANSLGQLNALSQIFSLDKVGGSMMPVTPLYNVPDIAPLLHSFLISGLSFEDFIANQTNGYKVSIGNAMESPELFFLRKNRLLDHLLARFGEDLSSYTAFMLAKKFIDPSQVNPSTMTTEWKVLRDKLELLQEIATVEGERNQGTSFEKFVLLNQFNPGQWRWEIFDPVTRANLLRGNNVLANPMLCFNDLAGALAILGRREFYVISAAAPFQVTLVVNPPGGAVLASVATTFPLLVDAQDHIATILRLTSVIWDTDNVSGLETKICKQLGCLDHKRRDLVNLVLNRRFVFGFTGGQFNFSLPVTGFANPFLSAGPFATLVLAQAGAGLVVQQGIDPLNYTTSIVGPDLIIELNNGGVLIASMKITNEPGLETKAIINDLAVFFGTVFGSQEGFYLVEHIQILPLVSTVLGLLDADEFLPNPYQYQVSIIVPDGTDPGLLAALQQNRLRDKDFQILMEKQVQAECPANMYPYFFYPNAADTVIFQTRYKRWHLWKHIENGNLPALELIQSELVQWLNAGKPKHPAYIN